MITRHPRLAEATPQAKTQKYALASVQVLWNILVPMVAILFGFFGAMAEGRDDRLGSSEVWYNDDGTSWHRDAEGGWYSYDADQHSMPPS